MLEKSFEAMIQVVVSRSNARYSITSWLYVFLHNASFSDSWLGHSEVRLSFSTFVVEVRFSIELNRIS